jgi:hypothetical protein
MTFDSARYAWLGQHLSSTCKMGLQARRDWPGAEIEWLAVRVAMLGAEVDVREPPGLVAQLNLLAGRLQRAAAAG